MSAASFSLACPREAGLERCSLRQCNCVSVVKEIWSGSFCRHSAIQVVATGGLLVSQSSRNIIGAGLHLQSFFFFFFLYHVHFICG